MKYLREILHGSFFVAFIKLGRIKPLYEVVGCLLSQSVKQTMCLLNCKRISVPMHTSTANCFPQCMYGRLVLDLLESRDNIAVLTQFITFDAFPP